MLLIYSTIYGVVYIVVNQHLKETAIDSDRDAEKKEKEPTTLSSDSLD